MPKLNNNDTEYLVVEWLAPDGAEVGEEDPVVVVETSKAAEELPAGASGALRHVVGAGAWCRPDEVIATIGAPAEAVVPREHTHEGAEPLVTAPAQALIDELGLTPEQVRGLGVAVVRRADVERLATAHPPAGIELSRGQRAVARTVALSHRTVPAAYLAVRMDLGPALDYARARTKEIRRPVGLAEIFVQAVAGLHARFPLFFATPGDTHATMSDKPDIGVTLDLGNGLYVPVIHDAAARTLKEIAATLMRHRLAATSGEFKEADLTGANFVVTLHTEGGVVLAIPLVFPGTACALAVTSPGDGTPADIGLAYDHRLINGRDAALFMSALKESVEELR
ncbi:2-oxoglutarate dehydrogenase E2 component (dihydrolipoamide succinyltransferase) [Nonomuraea polychroma]|uniref:Dihydrolipoamide acetyltransferase component of pyruvate dehydrogenase complex n=1 Tax=Nonomuraea polychroma TaxID=46176 RepID=A0A438LX60_9ACTN|nr:2-oxoglutarate dehydrogenase E2 component (dihydrolipoamide succinyltransferase) [Nonomuraea polychroma]